MSSNAKARLIFWLRMFGWTAAGVAAPTITFATKFGLFNVNSPTVDTLGNVVQSTSVSLNGWGIVCCLLLGSYVMQILKEVMHANSGYSLTKQCYDGIVKTVPYAIAYGVCFFLNGVISQIMFCLAVLIICRIVAIPLNPLPKWRYEKTGVEDYRDLLSGLTEIVKKLKKGDS
jgi:hypothetical protein